jgi:hypothetical protein
MANDKKHQTALAARRARDKKARDTLADSYIRKLIRKKHPEFRLDISDIHPDYVAATKIHLAIRRRLWYRSTPEMEAAFQEFADKLKRKIQLKSNRKP